MADSYDRDCARLVIYRIANSPITDTNAPAILFTFYLDTAGRPGILSECDGY